MKTVSLIVALVLALTSANAYGSCDFSTDIQKMLDGNYSYTKDCHIKVGELVQDNEIKDKQIVDYKKAIELKDLAITVADKRTQLWMDTTFKLEDNINRIDSFKKTNQWIYFGLGALTMFAAAYAAGQVINGR